MIVIAFVIGLACGIGLTMLAVDASEEAHHWQPYAVLGAALFGLILLIMGAGAVH